MNKRRINRYLADALIYSVLGCFTYFLLIYKSDFQASYTSAGVSLKRFLAILLLFNGVGLSVRYITEKQMSHYQFYLKNKTALSVSLVVVAILLFTSNYFSLVFAKMIAGLPHPFMLPGGKWLYAMLAVWLVELIIVGQSMQNRFYADLVKLYKDSEELREKSEQTCYRALQSQLDPHFLFNSLNTLVSEIAYNPDNAIEFTRNLADSYRYILKCHDRNSVPLSEELDFMTSFIHLHNVRLGNCIEVDMDIDEKYLEASVPPLTLQLLVENVVKHNTITPAKPMKINVTAGDEDGKPCLSVSNPIRPRQGIISTGTGLENLSKRFELLCGQEIAVDDTNGIFTVKTPLIYEED